MPRPTIEPGHRYICRYAQWLSNESKNRKINLRDNKKNTTFATAKGESPMRQRHNCEHREDAHKPTRGVAQLVSAPRSGRGGRKFESSHPDPSRVKCLQVNNLQAFFKICRDRFGTRRFNLPYV